MLSCHYLISGRVQGVGFRAFAQATARSLEIKGWIRNLTDGRVEILAIGEIKNLEEFEKFLRDGPPHARVDELEVKLDTPETFVHSDFILLRDGDPT